MLSKFVDSAKKTEFCSCTTKTLIVVQLQTYGRTTIGHSFSKEHEMRYKSGRFSSLWLSRLKILNLR